MSDVVNLPISLDSDLGRELTVDLARYRENLLDEKSIRKKYRLADDVWEKLGDDDALIRKVEEESVRRVRDGSAKREKAQSLIVAAPDVLSGILLDDSANARHRIDSAKVLNDFASTGSETAAASARFEITINLGSDTERYSKSIEINADDVDPYAKIDTGMIAAIAKKTTDGGNGGHI